jgi:hypothetical protein
VAVIFHIGMLCSIHSSTFLALSFEPYTSLCWPPAL